MDDAEFFLPSEIARLVYGHLRTIECDDVSSKFLNTSPNLSECRELLQRNRTFKTEANGLSLKEILDQYLNMNKLILSTVNKVVGDRKFCDPVEALNYILSQDSSLNDRPTRTMVNANKDIRDDLSIHSSSSEDMCSDFSLNLKTPVKRNRKKIPPKKFDSNNDTAGNLSDMSDLETTLTLDNIQSKTLSEIIPRQSTRLQNKRASKNDRLTSSDGIKELRKDPLDGTETPCILGKPPYSETKIQKAKNSLNLSSDSEPETRDTRVKSTPKPPDEISSPLDLCKSTVNGLPNLENDKVTPKKKTLKVLRPQRPSNKTVSPLKRPCKNEKTKCKRNRVSTLFHNDSSKGKKSNESVKSKETDIPAKQDDSDKPQRSSEELVFTTDPLPGKPAKSRRKSVNTQNDEEKAPLRQSKSNKSLNVIDDELPVDISVIKEKLIDYTKLHEHLAANINKVIINSPQKTITSASTEDLDNVIQKVVIETESHPLFDEILNDLMRDLEKEGEKYTEDQNSNLPAGDYCAEEINPVEETNTVEQSQLKEIEEPVVDAGDDVESHTSEPTAIIIELQQEQISNENYVYDQRKDFQKSISIAEDIRSYVSCTADIASSPDHGDQIEVKTHDGMINLYSAQNGEIIRSCKVSQESEKIYLNPNSVLYPVSDGVPVVFSESSEIQICGKPTPLSQTQVSKQKYVPIAPKPNTAPQSFAEITRGHIPSVTTRKKRTRGGKRGT